MGRTAISAKLPGVRALSTILVALTLTTPAGAQVFGAPRNTGPSLWVSGGTGWVQGGTISDGTTKSTWGMGQFAPVRLSVEFENQGQAIGAAVSHATVPMTYVGESCARCDANIDMLQTMGIIRAGGRPGQGFHQILELGAGVTRWSKLTATGTGTGTVTALKPDHDLTFQIGYGFGMNFGQSFALSIVQDLATIIHQKEGLSSGQNRSLTQSTTRISARLKLGK